MEKHSVASALSPNNYSQHSESSNLYMKKSTSTQQHVPPMRQSYNKDSNILERRSGMNQSTNSNKGLFGGEQSLSQTGIQNPQQTASSMLPDISRRGSER